MAGKLLEASAVVFLLFASFAALSAFGKAPAPAQYHAPAEIYPQGSGSGLDADKLDSKEPGALSVAYAISAGSVAWSGISGMPAGFADNVDDVGGGIGGSGSANYLAKWTGGTSLGNSVIYDNGNVGIGTTSPGQKLDVQGNIKISGAGNGIIFPDGTTLSSASTTPDLYGFFHSTAQCTFFGGYTRYVGSDKICVFPNSNICLGPFVQYQSYTTTGGGVCVGSCGWVSGNTCYTQCGGSTRTCTIGYHSWSNTNTIESCSVGWGGAGACYHTTTCNAVRTEIGCY